jgi:hypothetical protein
VQATAVVCANPRAAITCNCTRGAIAAASCTCAAAIDVTFATIVHAVGARGSDTRIVGAAVLIASTASVAKTFNAPCRVVANVAARAAHATGLQRCMRQHTIDACVEGAVVAI